MTDCGVLLFSACKGEAAVLLWKESRAPVSELQSGTFHSSLVARFDESDPTNPFTDWNEAILHSIISSKVLDSVMNRSSGKEEKKSVEKKYTGKAFSKEELLKRIKKASTSMWDLNSPSLRFPLIWVPVPYIKKVELPTEALWVSLTQIISSINEERVSSAELSVTALGSMQFYRLYLPFVATLRRNLEEIMHFADILKNDFKLKVLMDPLVVIQKEIEGKEESMLKSMEESDDHVTIEFRCRKCRKSIFNDTNIVDHQQGSGQTSFAWRKRDLFAQLSCNGYFLDVENLGDDISDQFSSITGKWDCPYCKTKVGSYNWSGAQCSCGAWIAPAIKVAADKVDPKRIQS